MNYTRAVGIARFVLLVLVVALFMTIAVCGYEPMNIGGVFDEGTITLGLDLQGGSIITFEASAGEGEDVTNEGMSSVSRAMRTRLDNAGLTEASCYLVGSNMITIEIPGKNDPDEAIKNFGSTGALTFRMYNSETGAYDKVVLTGDDVEHATGGLLPDINENGVALQFTSAGADKFYEATKAAASMSGHNYIYIYMDEELISSPAVDEAISGGNAVITNKSKGGMPLREAEIIAGNINAGALKYSLKMVSVDSVGPSLGDESLSTSLQAGAIGIAAVIVFMIAVYRIPGICASLALAAYTALFMLVMSITKTNLTLPGIAGIILSIGMAVDANVVIFERMKEEMRKGKSAKAAIKEGYSKAFSAILDSNVTTFIAAAVLYFLGSGTIKGFAVTLGFGVIISFFTALVITRWFLSLFYAMGYTRSKLFGVKERSVE